MVCVAHALRTRHSGRLVLLAALHYNSHLEELANLGEKRSRVTPLRAKGGHAALECVSEQRGQIGGKDIILKLGRENPGFERNGLRTLPGSDDREPDSVQRSLRAHTRVGSPAAINCGCRAPFKEYRIPILIAKVHEWAICVSKKMVRRATTNGDLCRGCGDPTNL